MKKIYPRPGGKHRSVPAKIGSLKKTEKLAVVPQDDHTPKVKKEILDDRRPKRPLSELEKLFLIATGVHLSFTAVKEYFISPKGLSVEIVLVGLLCFLFSKR